MSDEFVPQLAAALVAEDAGSALQPLHFQGNGSDVIPVADDEEVVWRSVKVYPREGSTGEYAQAAHVLELLPAMPTAAPGNTGAGGTYGTALNKAGYRAMAAQAVILAHGGEGLFSNFVETMVEANATGFENRLASNLDDKGNPTERTGPPWVEIFNTFNRLVNADPKTGQSLANKTRGIDTYQAKFVWQWWTTGLVVVLYSWAEVQIPELEFRRVQIPNEMTILDPLRIDLDDYLTKGIVYYEYDAKQKKVLLEEVRKLQASSVGQPVSEDDPGPLGRHPFFALYLPEAKINRDDPKNAWTPSRESAFAMLKNKSKVPLPPGAFKVIRRIFNDNEVYPVPFAVRLFPAINDKRMLRNMDRSVIKKVVMMILQISMKTQEKNRPRALHIEKTIKAMEAQLTADPEYVQIVALPEGTDMKWVVPDASEILNQDKYRTVNFEVLSAMVGLVASQILDGGGQMDLSLIGEQLWRKNSHCLHVFKNHMMEIYDQIRITSNIKKIKPRDVSLVFKQFNPFTSDAYRVFIGNMVARGLLPVALAADHIGEDFASIVQNLMQQSLLTENYGIFQAPPTNVQTMQTANPDSSDADPEKIDKQPPGMGRPPGTVDKTKRVRDSKNKNPKPAPSQDV